MLVGKIAVITRRIIVWSSYREKFRIRFNCRMNFFSD